MKAKTVFRILSALWIVWGLVHMLAGILTIAQDAPSSNAAIADAVDPSAFHSTCATTTAAKPGGGPVRGVRGRLGRPRLLHFHGPRWVRELHAWDTYDACFRIRDFDKSLIVA